MLQTAHMMQFQIHFAKNEELCEYFEHTKTKNINNNYLLCNTANYNESNSNVYMQFTVLEDHKKQSTSKMEKHYCLLD